MVDAGWACRNLADVHRRRGDGDDRVGVAAAIVGDDNVAELSADEYRVARRAGAASGSIGDGYRGGGQVLLAGVGEVAIHHTCCQHGGGGDGVGDGNGGRGGVAGAGGCEGDAGHDAVL